MYCPKCRSEFREGITRCTVCDVALVDVLPGDEDTFSSPAAMARSLKGKELEAVVVGNYAALLQAQHGLAEARIPSVVAGEAREEIDPGLHARFFLMVDTARLEDARAYFREQWQKGLAVEGVMLREDADLAALPTSTCPACNATVPDDASECPECGLNLGATADSE